MEVQLQQLSTPWSGEERRQLVFIAYPEASPCFCRYEHLEKEPVEGKERMSR